MAEEIITHSAEETINWGREFSKRLKAPMLVLLTGDLGSGKTTLTQAICRGYGVTDDVTSPTFTIVHEYAAAHSKVYHLDLYRMRTPRELETVGWDDILADRALVIVEWPERAAALMPRGHVPISLSHIDGMPDRRLLYAGGHT